VSTGCLIKAGYLLDSESGFVEEAKEVDGFGEQVSELRSVLA